ncbi:hypothetical protein L914_02809 [Phytophthora nicotianae]|uniref:Uncharacterized protein n=1 Tax=Phytophthora nicotianae TaxID=4792 RepID=W2NYB9_PHYNI|nr:hypothetical protein L914_02809 [Phytophthora nicotianae]
MVKTLPVIISKRIHKFSQRQWFSRKYSIGEHLSSDLAQTIFPRCAFTTSPAMATGIDFEVEGTTTFGSLPDESFRYLLSLKSEKINLWLENRTSKKQWQSGFLSKEEYVTTANAFVDASAADYISCFKQCLDCSVDETQESQRKLVSLKGDTFQLEMNIKIRLLRSFRNVSYVFKLEPVAVELIDILASKLKDQQEELEKLRSRVDETERVVLYAESTTWTDAMLRWEPLNSGNFVLSADSTSIIIVIPGLYAISVLVSHVPVENSTAGAISLQKNGIVIQRAAAGSVVHYCRYNNSQQYASHRTSTSLMSMVQVKADESIEVLCSGTSYITDTASYLTVIRIGS